MNSTSYLAVFIFIQPGRLLRDHSSIMFQFYIITFKVDMGMPSCSAVFALGTFAVLSTLCIIPNFSWIDHGFHFMHVLDVAMLISCSVNIHHIPGKNCSHATGTRSLYKFYTL